MSDQKILDKVVKLYEQEKNYENIAKKLGISESKVKRYVTKILREEKK